MGYSNLERDILHNMAKLEEGYDKGLVTKLEYIRIYEQLEEDLNELYYREVQ